MSEQLNQLKATIKGTLYLEVLARLCMDPTELMETYIGRLVWNVRDGEYVVGMTRWWVIRINEMADRRMNLFMMLDGEDADTADFGELVLEEGWEWPEAVLRVCPDALFGDLAILDRLVVYAPFRGKRVGLHCIEMTMRITGGMGLFALKPFPLQYSPCYEGRTDLAHEKSNLGADRKKLFSYYAQAGFKRVPRSKFMVFDPRETPPHMKWEDGEGDVAFERTEEMEQYRLKRDDDGDSGGNW